MENTSNQFLSILHKYESRQVPLFLAGYWFGNLKKEIYLLFFCPDAKSVLMLRATSVLFLKRVCLQKATKDCFSLVVGFCVFN